LDEGDVNEEQEEEAMSIRRRRRRLDFAMTLGARREAVDLGRGVREVDRGRVSRRMRERSKGGQ
jgi:hypothetical protein